MARSPSSFPRRAAKVAAGLLLALGWPRLDAAKQLAGGLLPPPVVGERRAVPATGAAAPWSLLAPPATRVVAHVPLPRLERLAAVPAIARTQAIASSRERSVGGFAAADAGQVPEPAAGPVWPRRGGPPQPMVGPRRDPVDPPLLDQQAWKSWVFAVRLNGGEVSQGALFLEADEGGRLLASVTQLRQWRVRLDETRILSLQGEPFYPLDAIAGLRVHVDRDELAIDLQIPPEALDAFALPGGEGEGPPPPRRGSGGFLDYDVLAQTGSGVSGGVGALLQLGAFGELGVFTTDLQAGDFDDQLSITRLESTFVRDIPARRSTLRLGDSLTFGGAFAQPVRFAGLQWATNFATDPAFVTFPTPAIGGLADQDSVVDVFVNNLRQATGEVPAGPFAIGNIPVVTGAGEVQLVVRDLLGRERIVTQPYYVSARLLRQGLHDFSYEAGLLRRRYGERSFDYGSALLAATHRYGLTDRLTLEGHLDAEVDRQSLAGGGSLRLGNWGVLSGGLGAGLDDGRAGALADLAYEYQSRRFSFGARSRYSTDEFVQAGGGHAGGRTDQLNFGFDLGALGRLGFLAFNQSRSGEDDGRSLVATYGLGVGPGSLMIRGAKLLEPDHDYALLAVYSLPLGGNRSGSLQVERTSDGPRARAQFRQGRGASDLGLDYRLAGELGDEAPSVDARFSYQATYGAAEVDLEHFDGGLNLRAGVTGSAGLIDGKARLSRRLGQAFGLVSVPGFANVRVYLDNRELGRTDEDGSLMLPELRPYEANRLRLEIDDLPLDAQVGDGEVVAVPYAGTGLTVRFDVRRERQATARLLDAAGRPLPAGLRLIAVGGVGSAWVAKDGYAQIVGGDRPLEVSGAVAGRRLVCRLPAFPAGELLPDLGEIACR